jgi:hypothetical protein
VYSWTNSPANRRSVVIPVLAGSVVGDTRLRTVEITVNDETVSEIDVGTEHIDDATRLL